MTKLSSLIGLGLKSEKRLNEIGIYTEKDLKDVGAINAYIKLKNECSIKPGLNFLYAMVRALEDKHWADIAKTDKTRLILELDGYKELEKLLKEDGINNDNNTIIRNTILQRVVC